MLILNQEQSKGLANFFFDLAKGLVLGGLGLTLVIPLETRLTAILVFVPLSVWFVTIALDILEDLK